MYIFVERNRTGKGSGKL